MSFINYESIPNHTDKKSIDYFFGKNPEFLTTSYICEHKYDGSNFQVIFTKESDETVKIEFASRSQILGENESFNNHKNVLAKDLYKNMLSKVEAFLKDSDFSRINLIGEIYGKVQKRIKYDEDKENKIIFFDVAFNNEYKTPKFFFEWAKTHQVPVVEHFFTGTFEECLAFDLNSVKTQAGDVIEGIVIKPFEIDNFTRFYVKLKMPGFEEITIKKKDATPKPKGEIEKKIKFKNFYDQNPDLEEFENYINTNRAISAFSKKAWTKKELPALANAILEDALKDFKIDHEETKINLDQIKKIFTTDIFKIINEEKFFL